MPITRVINVYKSNDRTYIVEVDLAHGDRLLAVNVVGELLEAIPDLQMDFVDGRQVAEYLLDFGLVQDGAGHLVWCFDRLFEQLTKQQCY